MFFSTKTVTVTKIYRKYKDGKVVEETIETTDDPKKAEDISAEADKTFGKMDKFFDKMDEAFKELF